MGALERCVVEDELSVGEIGVVEVLALHGSGVPWGRRECIATPGGGGINDG